MNHRRSFEVGTTKRIFYLKQTSSRTTFFKIRFRPIVIEFLSGHIILKHQWIIWVVLIKWTPMSLLILNWVDFSWSTSFGGSLLFYTTDNEGFLDTCLMNTCCWGCWSRVCCCCWIGCWLVCCIWPPVPLCGWSLSQRIWLWYWFCDCWLRVFLQNHKSAHLVERWAPV